MTIFSDNPYDRRMEQLMMTVPNFKPRGVGFRFTEAQLFITATAATVVESIMTDKLRKAILKLTDEEQLLIYRHYYAGISGTDLAEIYGVSQQAISKRIAKIRAKLKNLLEN